ncbi:hypothetical protein B0H14DRAFT_3521907 [Mycena olivaceomarginata]|nr:hypothetical protein B0H14DRAFT_3521907 [Mycena olivaceomarginata]
MSFELASKRMKKIARNREAADWMRTLIGCARSPWFPTPELETVLSAPLISLMSDGNSLLFPSKSAVLGAGSVLLQLLAVQHELGEPLNLNGDLLHDLLDDSVVPCPTGGKRGPQCHVRIAPFHQYKVGGDAIPVAVNGALKHKGAAEVEDAKPEKQVESSQAERKGKGETSGLTHSLEEMEKLRTEVGDLLVELRPAPVPGCRGLEQRIQLLEEHAEFRGRAPVSARSQGDVPVISRVHPLGHLIGLVRRLASLLPNQ